MSLLANDFLVAASKTAKTTVQVKKGEKINSFSFDSKSTRDELKNDLVEAEEIYNKLKGKMAKKKLEVISKKIESLRAKLEEEVSEDDVIEHDGVSISPPILTDIHKELKELDEQLDIPAREEPEEVKEEEVVEPEAIDNSLLHLQPPPENS
ncbi:hypothetical protein ISS09_04995 [Candidatus Woesearchaeota archaeon]|nr:hypothetical protein [Candidatus Woesearchaeota archaeon]